MTATEQYFPVVLFIMLYKVVLIFESADGMLCKVGLVLKSVDDFLRLVVMMMMKS